MRRQQRFSVYCVSRAFRHDIAFAFSRRSRFAGWWGFDAKTTKRIMVMSDQTIWGSPVISSIDLEPACSFFKKESVKDGR